MVKSLFRVAFFDVGFESVKNRQMSLALRKRFMPISLLSSELQDREQNIGELCPDVVKFLCKQGGLLCTIRSQMKNTEGNFPIHIFVQLLHNGLGLFIHFAGRRRKMCRLQDLHKLFTTDIAIAVAVEQAKSNCSKLSRLIMRT